MIDSSEASETPSAIDSSSESAMCSWRAMARGLVPNFLWPRKWAQNEDTARVSEIADAL